MVRVDAEQETREHHSHELIEGLKSRLLACARVRVRVWGKFPGIIQTVYEEMQCDANGKRQVHKEENCIFYPKFGGNHFYSVYHNTNCSCNMEFWLCKIQVDDLASLVIALY